MTQKLFRLWPLPLRVKYVADIILKTRHQRWYKQVIGVFNLVVLEEVIER